MANYHLAKSQNLTVVPVLNKIDIKHANPDRVCKELESLFEIPTSEVLKISAKLGTGVPDVLNRIISAIPPPKVNRGGLFRGFLFDSWYDKFRGALNLMYINDGSIEIGQDIQSMNTGKTYPVKSISLLRPGEEPVDKLYMN